MGVLRSFELVSIACFLALAVMAWRAARPTAVRQRTGALAAAVAALVYGVAAADEEGALAAGAAIREWLPVALLLLSYWLPAALVTGPHVTFERWLLAADRRLLASSPGRAVARAPRAVRELLELGYLAVYPMVPLSFGLLLASGLRAHADAFWTTVLTAEYSCYLLLPFLPTRPPREIEAAAAYGGRDAAIRRLNHAILGRASHHWNTFPSGHVAGAAACALAILPVLPWTGVLLLGMTALIAAGSVAGRYHYAADAAAGALTAALAAWLFAP